MSNDFRERLTSNAEDFDKIVMDILSEIDKIKEENRWIPVDEDVPDTDDQVWICYDKLNFHTYNAYYDKTYKTWNIFDYSGGYKVAKDNPTHWKSIVPPKVDNECEKLKEEV